MILYNRGRVKSGSSTIAAIGVCVARAWRQHGWLIIGLLWIFALVLGCIGFTLNASVAGRSPRLPDIAYRTLQLIPLNSGDVDGAAWPLDVARFLIPILAAWTAVRAFLGLFRDRWQQILVRTWSDHVVICGLSRKGWLLAQGFAARGERVVVIEADESHDLIGPCREHGLTVIVGDATDPDVLARASAPRAHHVVAVTDDDGVNAEIFVRCHALLRAPRGSRPGTGQLLRHVLRRTPRSTRRSGALTCTVHLVDPELYELARTREMAFEEGVGLQLELFNVFDRGARLLWSEYGPGAALVDLAGGSAAAQDGCAYHGLVVGLGRLGESLVVTAGRDWHTRLHDSPCRAAGRLRFTVVDADAERKCQALNLRYPQLASTCELVPLTMNVSWPEFYAARFLDATPATTESGSSVTSVQAAFICFDDDSLSLRTGLSLRQQLLKRGAAGMPVVVRMAAASGLARLIDPDGDDVDDVFTGLHAFPLLDRTCTPEAILGGTHELLARHLHEDYVEARMRAADAAADDESLVSWEQLSENLRRSNRAKADQLASWLRAAGYAIAPLKDWDAAKFEFEPEEIECLAQMEHERYVRERQLDGWTRGERDAVRKTNPTLIPYAELQEPDKEKNRAFVRDLPLFLARIGFELVRLIVTPSPQPLLDEPRSDV